MSYFIVNMDLRKFGRAYIISLAEVILIISIYICPKLLKFAEGLSIHYDDEEKVTRKFFIEALLISFAVFFSMYIIYYPGAFSPDSIDQYGQAAGFRNYKDWHPVLHTLFAFTLPLKISGGWIGSIVLFQIIVFSLALAYMAYTLTEFGNIKYARLFLLYILINPATLGISMYPWKDVSFAVFAMLAMCFAVRVYFSGGEWLKSPLHMIIFLLVIVAATIFRHNAILFTLPLLIAVIFYVSRKKKFLLAAGFVLIIFLVRGPLYSCLNVSSPGYRVEPAFFPMTVIGNAVTQTPERIDKDITDFAYKFLPKDEWQKHYVTGNFLSVAFRKVNWEVVKSVGYIKILNMMFRCFKESHMASLKGLLALTDMVFGIAGRVDWLIIPGIHTNSYGIKQNGISFMQTLFIYYIRFSRMFLKHIFWHIGVLLLITLIFTLVKLNLCTKSGWQKLSFVIPLFMHDYGTMLFIGGNDFRYFYCTYLVMPLLCLILLVKESD